MRIMVSVDNNIVGAFFNGTLIAQNITHGECPIRDEFRIEVPQNLVQPGQNLVAFHVQDRPAPVGPANESFFDARILADVPPPLQLIGLEVTQAIQDWNNSVPLIRDKTTFVRAHIQHPVALTVPLTVLGIPGLGAGLRGIRDGAELPDSPLTADNLSITAKPDAAARRGNLNDSLNFKLPQPWLNGTVELRLEGAGLDCQEAAGPTPNDCSVTVTFDPPTDELKVRFVAVKWTNQTGTPFEPSAADLMGLPRRLTAIYPIATLDSTTGFLPLGTLSSPPTHEAVILMLRDMRANDTMAGNRLYQGVISGVIGGKADGWGDSVSSTADRGPTDHTFAHELAHNLGLLHVGFCDAQPAPQPFAPFDDFPFRATIGGVDRATLGPMNAGQDQLIFGLDTPAPLRVFDPMRNFELMSYCAPDWISSVTYDRVRRAINRRFDPRPSPLGASESASAIAGVQDFLLVRGTIDLDDDTVDFLPFGSVETLVAPGMPAAGDFTLQLRDAAGSLIQEIAFEPTELHLDVLIGDTTVDDPGVALFLIPVPADPAIEQATVLHQGSEIGSRSATPSPPGVRVLFPDGGENISERNVTLRWTGSDPDNDPLTYLVQYSADGGATWEALVTDWPNKTLDVERRFLAGSNNALIRVQARDGFNTATDESDGVFSVLNNSPDVSILAPRANDAFSDDQLIFFEALTQDREDGTLPPSSLQWTSSIDGFLDTGNNFTRKASELSEGRHVIIVTAMDSTGFSSTASMKIRVSREPPPPLKCNGRPATIIGTEIDEFLTGTPGRDVIHGLGGNDTIRGMRGNDTICGGGGGDRLFGQGGNDTLLGQRGNDALDGGLGDDLCNGGAGRDTAVNCERVVNVPDAEISDDDASVEPEAE